MKKKILNLETLMRCIELDEMECKKLIFHETFSPLIVGCKLNEINPQKWVQYVLENITDYKVNKLHELLPNNIDPEKLNNFKKFWEV